MDIFEKFGPLLQRANELKANSAYYYMRVLESPSDAEVVVKGRKMINFASNNYLGLTSHPKVKEAAIAAIKKYGLGTAGSRILSGTLDLHEALESEIAAFKKKQAAVVFSTGYMANVGVVSSVAGRGDVVLIDEKCHASIIDGALISKPRIVTFAHNDIKDLRKKTKHFDNLKGRLIITDSVFSMDGDIADLPGIISVASECNARVMIDEAHSTGIFGETGSGIVEYYNLKMGVDIEAGTLSKALGGLGGYVAGDAKLISYLKHGARSFLFATSLPSPILAGVGAALHVMKTEPELIKKLWANIKKLRDGLIELGFDLGRSNSAIVPILIGEEKKAHKAASFVEDKGIFVNPVAFPAVEKDKAILRLSVMATHSFGDIDKTLDIFSQVRRKYLI